MKLIALTALFPLIACLAAPLTAQPTPEMLAQSEDYVRDARAAMEAGARRTAIITALMALPDTPDEADLADYPDAYEMLFRTMAARIVAVDREAWQAYTVSSDGTRAVVMPFIATQISAGSGERVIEFDTETQTMVARGGPEYLPLEDEPPHILVDARTGELVAELLPFAAVLDDFASAAFPPAFSPDGTEVAFWHMADGLVLRFAALDGTPLPPLADLAGRRGGHVIGYAPDGGRIAARADGRAAIWDVQTGALIESMDLPVRTLAADWTHDGTLLALSVDGYEAGSPVGLWLWRDGGWDRVVDMTDRVQGDQLPNQYMQVSKQGPHVLLDAVTWVYLVDYEADTVLDLGAPGAAFHRFVRDGAAVAVLEEGGLMSFLRGVLPLKVIALNGTELEPAPRDWVSFDQYAPNSDRAPRSFGSLRPYTYRGDDLPDGPALWQAAMDMLTEEERAEVAAGRIQ